MNVDKNRPLYSLSIQEFMAISESLIKNTVKTLLGETSEQSHIAANAVTGDDTLDISGLAKFLNCSKVSVHTYKKKGLPFYRIGRKVIFKKQEVLDFMKSLRKNSLSR